MLNVMKNSALSAKVHAMQRTTLHKADYEALIQLRSVAEVAAYLKEHTRYAAALDSVNPAMLHRGQMEGLLKAQIMSDILSLLPYFDISNRFFIETMELEEAIEVLKVFLNLLMTGHTEQFSLTGRDLRIGKSVLSARQLAEAADFSALLELLRPTVFYRPLRSFADDPERQTPFYLDIALDNFLAERTDKYTTKYLGAKDAAIVRKAYGAEVDLHNLTYILRAKLRLDMSKEQLYACIIPVYYRLRQGVIAELAECTDYREAVQLIKEKTPYGDAVDLDDRFIEKRVNEYLFAMQRRLLRQNPYSIQIAVGYLALRRFEIKNIVSIIEGIRYGLPPNQIKDYLVGVYGEEESA